LGEFVDKKEELINKIKEYDEKHNEYLRRFMLFLGRRQKALNNPIGRFIVAKITTKLLAYFIVKFKLFGVEKKENPTLIDIALNWLKPSIFFRIPYEIEEVSEERIVILRPECTVGFDKPEHSKICRASMNMDIEIIKKLGGKLTVTETILEGAKSCRHIIEKEK
jgi:hypothetical protein